MVSRQGPYALVEESDITGRYVHQVDIQRFQLPQNSLHFRPTTFELFPFLSFPFVPFFLGEIRQVIKIRTCEIQNEWPDDDSHFDNTQPVINTDKLRDIEAQDLPHARPVQSFIYGALTLKGFASAMNLYRRFSGFGIVSSHKNDTMNTEAQPLGEAELVLLCISPSVLDQKFFHDHVIESGRPLRPSENATVCERQFHRCCSDGTGFSNRGRAHQPSARKREPASPSGPKRNPLGRASARRHLCCVQAGRNRLDRVAASLRIRQVCFQSRRQNRRSKGPRSQESAEK
jgi:hypothetical protein